MWVASHPPFSVGFPADDENAAQKLRRALDNHILRPARRADSFYQSYCGETFRVPDCNAAQLDSTGRARLCLECLAALRADATIKPEDWPFPNDEILPGWTAYPKLDQFGVEQPRKRE